MSAMLDKIKEEMKALTPEEVREIADSLLSGPASPAYPLNCTFGAALA
jgi:hypothetical protein